MSISRRVRDMDIGDVEDLVLTMVRAVVDRSQEVRVKTTASPTTLVFDVYMPKDEVKFVMGRNGQMMRALNTVLIAACRKHDLKYTFNIVEL